MKTQLLLVSFITTLASAPLYAGDHKPHGSFRDQARVVNVTPIYETVAVPTERRECWTEEVQGARSSSSGAGAVVGGIIGGVVGHQLGRGDMRKVTTVAGTVIGAAVGASAGQQGSREVPYTNTEHHCRVRTDYVQEQHLRAYRVTYRYHGETFVTEMARDPGRFVPVRVQVSLID